jgi:hypothetical protein
MTQQPYDILGNIIISLCGILGIGAAIHLNSLMLGVASSIALLSVIAYLFEMPKVLSLTDKDVGTDRDYHLSKGICEIVGYLSVFAVSAECGIILVLIHG